MMTDLETATVGTRELDDEVLLACGWKYNAGTAALDNAHWIAPDGSLYFEKITNEVGEFPPCPTRSLDDDLMLVPEGWWLFGLYENRSPITYARDRHKPLGTFTAQLQHTDGGRLIEEKAATPALALSAAILKAVK